MKKDIINYIKEKGFKDILSVKSDFSNQSIDVSFSLFIGFDLGHNRIDGKLSYYPKTGYYYFEYDNSFDNTSDKIKV